MFGMLLQLEGIYIYIKEQRGLEHIIKLDEKFKESKVRQFFEDSRATEFRESSSRYIPYGLTVTLDVVQQHIVYGFMHMYICGHGAPIFYMPAVSENLSVWSRLLFFSLYILTRATTRVRARLHKHKHEIYTLGNEISLRNKIGIFTRERKIQVRLGFIFFARSAVARDGSIIVSGNQPLDTWL